MSTYNQIKEQKYSVTPIIVYLQSNQRTEIQCDTVTPMIVYLQSNERGEIQCDTHDSLPAIK